MSNKWSFVFNVLGLSIYNHDDWIYRIHRGIKSTLYSQIKFSSIISLVNHHCLHSNLIPFSWSSKKVIYLVWCSFLLCVCVCEEKQHLRYATLSTWQKELDLITNTNYDSQEIWNWPVMFSPKSSIGCS